MLSKKNRAIIEADMLGYYCDERGNIYKPNHEQIKGSTTGGYKSFAVKLGKEWVTITFHRFIAYQRKGDTVLMTGVVVRHLDNNRLNNTWNNIAVGSPRENYMDLSKTVRISRARHAALVRHAA